MSRRFVIVVAAILAVTPLVRVAALAIPDDQIEKSRIYYGSPANFEHPAEVDMDAALQATPEFDEIVRKKVRHGTGKYWILVSVATDRVHRAISQVGRNTDYDLIAEQGYLGDLEPQIECDDVTEAVIDRINGD
jgi:hypothetical protein